MTKKVPHKWEPQIHLQVDKLDTRQSEQARSAMTAAAQHAINLFEGTAKDERGYNGWKNYETWNVALWIGNEEASYKFWRLRAAYHYSEADADNVFSRDEVATRELADELKEHFERDKDSLLKKTRLTASMWADLLGASLGEVNWHEIAVGMIEEVDK
jgi:hypothetical protein